MKDAYSIDADLGAAQHQLRRDVRGLLPDLRPLRTALCDRRGRERSDRRRLVARVHGPLLHRRRQGHLSAPSAATRPTRSGPRSAATTHAAIGRPPRTPRLTRPCRPPTSGRSARSASSSGSTSRPRPNCWSTWPTASRSPRSCGATTSSTRPSSAGRSVPRRSSRPTRRRSRRPPAHPWVSSGRSGSRSRW